MEKIGLIEGRGSGFRKWFRDTTTRSFLPIPTLDFDSKIGDRDGFTYTIYGFSIDDNFVKILQTKKAELQIQDIILLDRVAKKQKITTSQFNLLKKQGLVEGKPTKCILSLEITKICGIEEIEDKKNQIFNFRPIFESSFLAHLKTKKEGMAIKEIIEFAVNHIKYTDKEDAEKLKSDIKNSLTKLKKNKKIVPVGKSHKSIKWVFLNDKK
jgi:hypothetical protein